MSKIKTKVNQVIKEWKRYKRRLHISSFSFPWSKTDVDEIIKKKRRKGK